MKHRKSSFKMAESRMMAYQKAVEKLREGQKEKNDQKHREENA